MNQKALTMLTINEVGVSTAVLVSGEVIVMVSNVSVMRSGLGTVALGLLVLVVLLVYYGHVPDVMDGDMIGKNLEH